MGTLHKQSSGSVERIHQSRNPEGCTYQSSDPKGYRYQSSDPERYTYQSSDPEGCTYRSSDPEGCTYQSRTSTAEVSSSPRCSGLRRIHGMRRDKPSEVAETKREEEGVGCGRSDDRFGDPVGGWSGVDGEQGQLRSTALQANSYRDGDEVRDGDRGGEC
ncbi:NBS-LRR type resistance protein [Cucumis melo var. makuwa]|uniref:NBS-LRR type resistance protein n=1 Tax=Cucumis melo var. makuwa TaxID=1194695 RepID=A0A5D3CET6_CUCMM|nr:NBS-LRR type resistance protein [Cucumis melo var. makuwa]